LTICAIDPGKPPKTVFASNGFPTGITHGSKWFCGRTPPPGVFAIIAAEKPAGVIRVNRTPASVISPAGWGMAGMFSLQLAGDGLRCWIPMEAWKEKIYRGGSRTKKAVFCAQLVKEFRLVGLDPEDESDQDVIDAIGLAEAVTRFDRKELKKWHVKW
jgi:hypothetical protein